MEIIHTNIIYISFIDKIGGVETYVHEIAKKFNYLDIALVYKQADPIQLARLEKYIPCYKHTDQKITCKVAVINYDTSIINYINEESKIYCGLHCDYKFCKEFDGTEIPKHPRIYMYIALTQYMAKTFIEMTGYKNVIVRSNPLTIFKEQTLLLVSATRLSKIKGKNRMITLAKELDKAKVNYLWLVFTDDYSNDELSSANICFLPPRIDIIGILEKADYLVQLSDSEGLSYAINEALYMNIPLIVTPLPYLEEIGVRDNINCYIMNFDCSNVKEIVTKITNIPKFEFKHLEDGYDTIFEDSKSKYKEIKSMKYLVEATDKYVRTGTGDGERAQYHNVDTYIPQPGERWEVEFNRAQKLEAERFVKIIERIPTNVPRIENHNEEEELDIKKLKKLKKSELIVLAEKKELVADDTMTKDTIINLITNN